jgi:hypothetical protein
MNAKVSGAKTQFEKLLADHPETSGMYVRVHGDNLIAGRYEKGADGSDEQDDRVRLTLLGGSRYGLSVKRHTGRWEKTPFMGSLDELVETMLCFMQHILAPY